MITRLLKTQSVMILDGNDDISISNRRYKNEVAKADECERKLRYLVGKTNDYLEDDDENGTRTLAVMSGNHQNGDPLDDHEGELTIHDIDEQLTKLKGNIDTNGLAISEFT